MTFFTTQVLDGAKSLPIWRAHLKDAQIILVLVAHQQVRSIITPLHWLSKPRQGWCVDGDCVQQKGLGRGRFLTGAAGAGSR